MRDCIEYAGSGDHLPRPLRDFHDAKDLFRLMHRTYGRESDGEYRYQHEDGGVNWVMGQCYTVDWFLWFMAQRGWTLQRSRAAVNFRDLEQEIQQMKEQQAESLRRAIASVDVTKADSLSGS